MKKGFTVLLVMFMVVASLAGCAGTGTPAASDSPSASATVEPNGTATPAPTEAPKSFKVGWSIDTISTPFNAAEDEAIKKAFAKYPEITLYATEAQAKTDKQISDIEDLVSKGIDLLIVKPRDEATLATVLTEVKNKGIPVICMDRYVKDENAFTTFIGSDNVQVGRFLAEEVVKATSGKANIVFNEGTPGGSSYLDRIEGFNEYVKDYPDIKIIATQPCNAKRDEGKKVMENWITAYGDQIDVVISLTDENTMGVIQAIDESSLKDKGIKVFSVNGAMEALNEIKSGKIDWIASYATGLHPAVEVAWAMLNGLTDVPKEIIIPSFGVDASNVELYYDANLYIVDYVEGGTPAYQEAIKNYPNLKDLEIRK